VPLATTLSPLVLVSALTAANATAGEDGTWRFRDSDRPIKVAVVAGSIGAYAKGPFHRRIEDACPKVEVKNLSKTGIGAFAMKQVFKDQVVDNWSVRPGKTEGDEHWLMFAAGVNSIGMPKSTNHHLRRLMTMAHNHGMKVLALSPAPWGTDKSSKFQGLEGLHRRRATQLVTDFLMGKLDPDTALGEHANSRKGSPDKFEDDELPDIAVDIYDSPLRDSDAAQRDVQAMREEIGGDRSWKRDHKDLDAAARAAQLEADAWMAADVPRWFMKPDYQAFDHVHPNEEGHRIIAEVTCPKLPASWGCDCSKLEK
jgi:hypothetical protein